MRHTSSPWRDPCSRRLTRMSGTMSTLTNTSHQLKVERSMNLGFSAVRRKMASSSPILTRLAIHHRRVRLCLHLNRSQDQTQIGSHNPMMIPCSLILQANPTHHRIQSSCHPVPIRVQPDNNQKHCTRSHRDLFNCALLNARSLNNKLPDFHYMLSSYSYNMIFVTETWFSKRCNRCYGNI